MLQRSKELHSPTTTSLLLAPDSPLNNGADRKRKQPDPPLSQKVESKSNPEDLARLTADVDREAFNMLQRNMNQNIERLAPLLKKGDAHAEYMMAQNYRYGWGVHPKSSEFLKLSASASGQGHAGACLELVDLYLHGDSSMDIKKDYDEAERLATVGVERGRGITKWDQDKYKQSEMIQKLESYIDSIPYMRQVAQRNML